MRKETYLADFHLHLDGSLMVKIIEKLLELPENENNNLKDKWKNFTENEKIAFLSVPDDCENLDDYLKCFDLPCNLLQTPDSIYLATKMLVEELADQGLNYANLRFAPQLLSKEVPEIEKLNHERKIVNNAIYGAIDAIEELKRDGKEIDINFILCCMRNKHWGENEETFDRANERTVKIATELYGISSVCGIIGVDLAGGEYGNPNKDYDSIIEKSNVPLIIHSGESGETNIEKLNNISYAIEHGAKFIGHGTALECAFFDEDSPEKQEALKLIDIIKTNNIFIEVCLTSNMQTKAVNGGIYNHPFAKLLKSGVKVVLCTDNMMVSNTTLKKEYELATKIAKSQGIDNIEELLSKNASEAAKICKGIITQSHDNKLTESYADVENREK